MSALESTLSNGNTSKRPLKICFIIPTVEKHFVGGYRVHYEYANRLAARGHDVDVAHMITPNWHSVRQSIKTIGQILSGVKNEVNWFKFHANVSTSVIPKGWSPKKVDVLVLTAWQTSEVFGNRHDKAKLIAQIAYDYEFWMSADKVKKERMAQAFRKPDVMFSTSKVVSKMLKEVGRQPDFTIYCGFDSDIFRVTNDYLSRKPVVGILLRTQENKRVSDAIEALSMLREGVDFHVVAGGQWSKDLPDWIERVDISTDEKIRDFYNLLSIFVLPSEYEGWGLPAVEALACGAAVVSTRNGGVEDFLIDGDNALLVPPKSPCEIALAVERLVKNKQLRENLVLRGLETVKTLEWETPSQQLENSLTHELNKIMNKDNTV